MGYEAAPLGWIVEEDAKKYFLLNDISYRNRIVKLLPLYMATIKGDMSKLHLNTCCLIVKMYVDKDVHRNIGSLPLNVIVDCLEQLGRLGDMYVSVSEENGVQVSQKLKDSLSKSTPRLISLVARNTFLSIMARENFNLEDLSDLIAQFDACKERYTEDDLRRLRNYLSNLKEHSGQAEKLERAAKTHTESIEGKLEGESSLNVKLMEYCDFLRHRVQKLSAANPIQKLDNGHNVEAFCTPLAVAVAMNQSKLEPSQ